MKRIKTKFESFVKEQLENSNLPTSNEYNLKDLKKKLQDYKNQKNRIISVFQDDKIQDSQIPNLLKDLLKNKDINKFVFENDFSQLEADVCNLNRQIRKKELELKNLEEDSKNLKSNISPLQPMSKERAKESSTNNANKQLEIKNSLSDLRKLLFTKSKYKDDVLKDFEKRITNVNNEIRLNKS